MMTDTQYGARVRAREAFNRKTERLVEGNDHETHRMNIKRKAARGVSQFADVTKPMTAEKLKFIRTRATKTAKEAIQRQWILSNPFACILKRIRG
jgi:hypothetical protein